MAQGQPVKAAGEIRVAPGRIKYIDNSSGHYEPFGAKAQAAALNAFAQAGFSNIKYIEKIWVPHTTIPQKGSWVDINKLNGR